MSKSIYDQKPWLKFYDPGIGENIKIPQTHCADLAREVFSEFSDRAAVHFLGTTWSFKKLGEASLSFANFLLSCSQEPGNVVAINLPNIPQYLIAQAGAVLAGWAATGLSPLLSAKEMAYQLNDSGARVLVTLDAIFEKRFLEIKEQVPSLSHVVVTKILDFVPAYKRILGEMLKKVPTGKVTPLQNKDVIGFKTIGKEFAAERPKVAVQPSDAVFIQYTGGTTGLPKGTVLTHQNLVSNLFQAKQWLDFGRGQEIFCSAFPLFHLAGLAFGMSALILGNTQILIPNPRDTAHICKEINRYRPSIMANVPSLYQLLINDPRITSVDFSSVKLCISGAAPFPVESLKALEGIVGAGKVVEVYGMTETSPLITMNPFRGKKKLGSVGMPIPNTRVKLMDLETGTREVPLGDEGELVVCGPQVMSGYYQKPEESQKALRQIDGETWLFTGDVAKMDADGFFTLVDRSKDMLIVGGYKVFSREVEETLYLHPGIEICAIIGLPNPDRPGSELVKAIVQPKRSYPQKDLQQLKEDILNYCRKNMAPYKVPKIIEFKDQIPLTLVGKVDKKSLRST